MQSKQGRELTRRKALDSDPSRDKETKEKMESSHEEQRNQDRDKRATMGLKKREKQNLHKVSGKRELRHQQGTPTLMSTSQDKLVIKTLRPRESRGLLPSPRDERRPPKTRLPRLLSLLPRSFMVLAVKWLSQPPAAREPNKEPENKWQKELKSKKLTKRSSDSPPSKRRKPKRGLLKSNSELTLQREKKDKESRRERRVTRDEPRLKLRSLIRRLVLLYNKRPKTIRPEQKKTAKSSTKFDKVRKLTRRPRTKLENIERRKTKKEERKIHLIRWFTGLKYQLPNLKKLSLKLSKLKTRKSLRHHKVATNLTHQLRPRRTPNHEETTRRRSQPRPKKLRPKPSNPKKSILSQLPPKLCHPNQLQNPTNLLLLKRKTPNLLKKWSTKRRRSQSIKTRTKKSPPSRANSSPKSTTSAASKSASPDKRRRPRMPTKRTTSSKDNSSSVLMKIN